ncbi:MAG: 16S rRNA (cytosine(967)-C(5))-methyltransferase RsmB [Zoogloeaceae bacterium]|jgi:16S rRNA (cytosine967-C5)-methyltransferase|nr:16S rRNA (cytosine(967)-C(5))-methyltransferase RsmB [Zoogloeaceae bacterium]
MRRIVRKGALHNPEESPRDDEIAAGSAIAVRNDAVRRTTTATLGEALYHAALVVGRVIEGQSLAAGLLAGIPAEVRPQAQDLVYGVLRRHGEGEALLAPLLRNPPSPAVRGLLFAALHRLHTWPEAPHTVVHQAVEAAARLEGGCKGLVNGVLRNYMRRKAELEAACHERPESWAARLWHPEWWLRRLQADHPKDWRAIVAAGNQPPPMALRVNLRHGSAAEYLARLEVRGMAGALRGEAGILLAKPVPVDVLPGFFAGDVSVQDLGAQRAAELLAPKTGSAVLDACAAPGGKAAHLLERYDDLALTALDNDPARLARLEETFARLRLAARVCQADARQPWTGEPALFDAILADVPCTASGVARRHPDSKWLRMPQDVRKFAAMQQQILARLWPTLKPGGKLLYATCSVFSEEDSAQVERFLRRFPEARLVTEEEWLPDAEHDGFYYALLQKQA